MMSRTTLQRLWTWLCRFRYRSGYGVHSPFAFRLITEVIHQEWPYYAYTALMLEEKKRAARESAEWLREPLRVKRLLFRLANEVQADYLLDAGPSAASALYLQAARRKARYRQVSSADALSLPPEEPLHLLYLHDADHPKWVERAFHHYASHALPRSLFIVEGIGYTAAMQALWQRMQQDDRVGITFDLFDVGLIFFDRRMNKQHYKVRF